MKIDNRFQVGQTPGFDSKLVKYNKKNYMVDAEQR
jgi:hypothetical protein